jgi:PKHD-type hydroxylase
MPTAKKVKEEKQVDSSVSSVWSFALDNAENWAYWENLFTPEECKKIIEIGLNKNKQIALVGARRESKVRKSKIVWLHPSDNMEWVYEKISAVIQNLNSRYFNFDLFGMVEGMQFTIYEAPGGKYGSHIDRGNNMHVRKLSFSLQLSDPDDYTGGDLELYFSEEPTKVPREIGYAAVFPSYVLHGVKPVTKGTRYSLVVWVTGPAFK